MVDPDVLEKFGCTQERLKAFFSAESYPPNADVSESERHERDKLVKLRKRFEERIDDRVTEGITFSLQNHTIYSAVDLAWDAPPITKSTYPLILLAQGKINVAQCARTLCNIGCADQFVVKDEKGEVVDVNLPKFFDVSFNLVRSIVSRRLAAQANKYGSLFPHYKYEARGTDQVSKLMGDAVSQRVEIIVDAYNYRHHEVQVMRDVFKYAHCLDFIESRWHCDRQFDINEETGEVINRVRREGLLWTNPHPTRILWDNSYPLSSINTDTGCRYVGYWDIARYAEIMNDPVYWNRRNIGYTSNVVDIFSTYSHYFTQYYCNIIPPDTKVVRTEQQNDRKSLIGIYSGTQSDQGMILINYFEKIVPKEWGLGDYPYPVWLRMVVAGWSTVIYAEWLPSTPCAYAQYNADDSRQINLSLAHEIMPYQDHMTNLISYMLAAIRSDNQKVFIIDIAGMSDDQVKALRSQAKGKKWSNETIVLEVDRQKMGELGVDMSRIIELVETRSSQAVTVIFQAMVQLMGMVERLTAMSPQEVGQPAPREISATEVTVLSNTTDSVYTFISSGFDSFRAAKKRIIYESLVYLAQDDFELPILNRYMPETILEAGFTLLNREDVAEGRVRATIGGKTKDLIHEYTFSSRDGSERISNIQSAKYLAEVLKTVLPIPAVQQALTQGQLADIVNELFRNSSAFDLKLQFDNPDAKLGEMQDETAKQIMEILDKVMGRIEQLEQGLIQLQQQGMTNVQQTAEPPKPVVGKSGRRRKVVEKRAADGGVERTIETEDTQPQVMPQSMPGMEMAGQAAAPVVPMPAE